MANPNIRLSLALDAGIATPPEMGALIFNALDDGDYSDLGAPICMQWFKPACDRLNDLGFVTTQQVTTTSDFALVEITRFKPQTLGLIAKAFDALNIGGTLVVNGDKTNGIESHHKTLRKLFEVEGVISKAHGKIFWLTKGARPDVLDQWLAGMAPVEIEEDFRTQAGVFSAGHVDKGSRLLLESLTNRMGGKCADLGAGWGYLSRALLERGEKVKSLDLVEADYNALNCARLNVTDPRASFHWNDATQFAGYGYDFIIMNPPFHQTRIAEPDIGKAFIAKASAMLAPKGQLWMVANRQLAYEDTLNAYFAQVTPVTETTQFKVINASRPKKPTTKR
jgi:16S rRNA (guanine1207-N2)-methyltransferase